MWTLDIASELSVVGSDAESADASNPRGEIIRDVWFVTATSGQGEVYAHCWSTESEAEARGWLDSIRAAVARADGWNPTERGEAWRHWRNIYGSAAHAVEGDDAEGEKRDALDEEERRGF